MLAATAHCSKPDTHWKSCRIVLVPWASGRRRDGRSSRAACSCGESVVLLRLVQPAARCSNCRDLDRPQILAPLRLLGHLSLTPLARAHQMLRCDPSSLATSGTYLQNGHCTTSGVCYHDSL